uniref:Uncharacterized protein n=1 Tax=Setaria italica TaxID=4555 RepID=K3ZFR1_SETIT
MNHGEICIALISNYVMTLTFHSLSGSSLKLIDFPNSLI